MMGNTTDPVNEESMKLVQLESPADGQDMAVMTTDKGVIKFVLYPEYAPKAVDNFKKLVKEGFDGMGYGETNCTDHNRPL